MFAGWTRTGESFKVYVAEGGGHAGVCRFFSTAFGPKSSHFYTPDATECGIVQANTNWGLEGVVLYVTKADLTGGCPSGSQPVYRLYNDGQARRRTIAIRRASRCGRTPWPADGSPKATVTSA